MFSRSALLAGGRRLYAREVIFSPIPEPGTPRPAPRLQFATFDGTAPEVIPTPADSVIWPYSMDCEAPNGTIHILSIPLRTWFPREAALPMGLMAVAHRDSLVVQIFDASTGQPVRRIERDLPRVEVTDARWESLPEVAEFRTIQEEANGDLWLPGDPGEPCELPRPELFAAIRAIVSDDLGRLWVETVTPSGFDLNVFDPDGTFIGHVAMPPRDPGIPFYVRGNRLYLVSSDELDLQSVEVYEVDGMS
jgi:hypothetical protein